MNNNCTVNIVYSYNISLILLCFSCELDNGSVDIIQENWVLGCLELCVVDELVKLVSRIDTNIGFQFLVGITCGLDDHSRCLCRSISRDCFNLSLGVTPDLSNSLLRFGGKYGNRRPFFLSLLLHSLGLTLLLSNLGVNQ